MQGKFGDNRHYTEYEALLKQLHQVIAAGKGDTPEADALRDEMDRSERELSYEEMARLRGLSADLYMLQGEEVYEPRRPGEDPSERAPERLYTDLQEARQRNDADAALTLLRKGMAGLRQDQRAYLRARAYEELEHLDTALLFMRHAAEQSPSNSSYKAAVLDLLDRQGQRDELFQQASNYVEDEASSAELRVRSAGVLFGLTRGMSSEQAARVFELIISRLEAALPLLEEAPKCRVPDLPAYGHLTLGFCYQRSGRLDDARNAFDQAMGSSRIRGAALAARGMLLVESNPDQAISDFEEAIRIGTPSIVPYLHLAHHALIQGDYLRCVELCDQALGRTQNPRLQAVVLQWEAIAGWETGAPTEQVRHVFEVALAIDPLNPQIRHNFGVFQQREQTRSVTSPLQDSWQVPVAPAIEAAELLQPLQAVAA